MDRETRDLIEAPRTCKYRINSLFPGAYVEGFGVLKTGTEVALPAALAPMQTWWPLNDEAWEQFDRHARVPFTDKEISSLHGRGKADEEDKTPEQLAKEEKARADARAKVAKLRKAAAEAPPPEPKKDEPEDDRMSLSEFAAGKKRPKRASDSE